MLIVFYFAQIKDKLAESELVDALRAEGLNTASLNIELVRSCDMLWQCALSASTFLK